MNKYMDLSAVSYIPILAISQAEMLALAELPDKDKDIMLPLFPLKGWGASVKLINSIDKIAASFGERLWIADIDGGFLLKSGEIIDQGLGKDREVHHEICSLSDSENGYLNWYEFLVKTPSAIPVVQLGDLSQLDKQIQLLESLGRGVVVRLPLAGIEGYIHAILHVFSQRKIDNLLVLLDLEIVNKSSVDNASTIVPVLRLLKDALPYAAFSISGSSFPDSFSQQTYGESSIYERILFNLLKKDFDVDKFVYSDRGGARVEKNTGGAPNPPPRIDYPLSNDWRFIRREYSDPKNPQAGEKERLYTDIAREMVQMEYWQSDLRLWGTQMIELTSQGEGWGISNPMKATAVRLNIHMHQQLCYDSPAELMDTDDDWTD